jgi:hypothetical protein
MIELWLMVIIRILICYRSIDYISCGDMENLVILIVNASFNQRLKKYFIYKKFDYKLNQELKNSSTGLNYF